MSNEALTPPARPASADSAGGPSPVLVKPINPNRRLNGPTAATLVPIAVTSMTHDEFAKVTIPDIGMVAFWLNDLKTKAEQIGHLYDAVVSALYADTLVADVRAALAALCLAVRKNRRDSFDVIANLNNSIRFVNMFAGNDPNVLRHMIVAHSPLLIFTLGGAQDIANQLAEWGMIDEHFVCSNFDDPSDTENFVDNIVIDYVGSQDNLAARRETYRQVYGAAINNARAVIRPIPAVADAAPAVVVPAVAVPAVAVPADAAPAVAIPAVAVPAVVVPVVAAAGYAAAARRGEVAAAPAVANAAAPAVAPAVARPAANDKWAACQAVLLHKNIDHDIIKRFEAAMRIAAIANKVADIATQGSDMLIQQLFGPAGRMGAEYIDALNCALGIVSIPRDEYRTFLDGWIVHQVEVHYKCLKAEMKEGYSPTYRSTLLNTFGDNRRSPVRKVWEHNGRPAPSFPDITKK